MIHMRNKCVLALLLAVILMLISSIALADTATVTASLLYLREEANSDSKALASLRKGTEVEIVGKSGHWYKVTYGKYTGYVYDDYITINADDDDSLRKGDKGSAVKAVQERLKELGYYKSTCDGSYGSVTVTAVKAFQKKNGLTQDGVVGETTLKKLNSSSAICADGTKISAKESAQTEQDDGTLKQGSKGTAVKELQQRLKELGYYKASCDGNYGDVTATAVKAFQKKNGLTADGVAGASTLKKLNSSSAICADGTKISDKESAQNEQDDGTLKQGSKGDAVKELQQRLKELGYYKPSCDGSYGSVTVTAVKAFQTKNGLTADGVAGAATLKKLNSSSAIGANDKTETEDKKAEVEDDGTLKQGSKGDAVKELQQRLKELGYYTYGCDGEFGARTVTAVKAFQKMNGLTQDGVVGASTLKKLNSDSAVYANGQTTASLNTSQTLKKGDSGAQVKALQTRLKELGYYTTTIDSDYGYRTATAVSDFQRANGLTVNGIANSTTLKKMTSSTAVSKSAANKAEQEEEENETFKTERLDWFTNGRSVFAGRPIIQIKDVRTGLVFNAKVLYGTNHLDVEPLTKADTAILLKINGGVDFSWRRRPMLVKHNGHVYAASIYSEPHGEQTILDNNFDGQFCLHFYGSKTHGTGEVKADHQACIAEAMKATW